MTRFSARLLVVLALVSVSVSAQRGGPIPQQLVFTALNQIAGPVEALAMIESEHDNLTPDKGRACPARTNEILDVVVHGGTFAPAAFHR